MNYDERAKAVHRILVKAKRDGLNIVTLALLMATMTNKPFDKFYNDFMKDDNEN